MKIIRSEEAEKWAFKKIKAWLTRRPRSTKGWHVSDLIYPLKAYWGRVKPLPITDEESLYFSAGMGHHSVLEACLGPRKFHNRADAGEFEKHGILFSPDLRLPFPLEIKTSRARKIPKSNLAKAYEGYLKQLCSYQALMNNARGALMVLYLNAETAIKWQSKPALRVFDVSMSKSEREDKVEELIAGAKKLTAAVKKRDTKGLPLCPEWLCRNCKWISDCKPWLRDKSRKKYKPAKGKK